MVRFKTLSRDEAKRIISAFDNYDDVEFDDLVNHWEQYDPVSEYDECKRCFVYLDYFILSMLRRQLKIIELSVASTKSILR